MWTVRIAGLFDRLVNRLPLFHDAIEAEQPLFLVVLVEGDESDIIALGFDFENVFSSEPASRRSRKERVVSSHLRTQVCHFKMPHFERRLVQAQAAVGEGSSEHKAAVEQETLELDALARLERTFAKECRST